MAFELNDILAAAEGRARMETEFASRGERIAAVLADLDGVMPGFLAPETHAGECWKIHTGCLAARIRATLTGDPT